MAWRNSEREWGTTAKLFHWTMAVLILGSSLFVLHVNDSLPWFKSSPAIFLQYIHWHKTFGLLALVLVLARLATRRSGPVPMVAALTPFEAKWSHRTHLALYALMILVPISGWLASSFFGSPTKVFGWFTIPAITPKWKPGVAIFYWVHFALAWAILALVAAHAIAACHHHFNKKDDVLRAMWFGRRKEA